MTERIKICKIGYIPYERTGDYENAFNSNSADSSSESIQHSSTEFLGFLSLRGRGGGIIGTADDTWAGNGNRMAMSRLTFGLMSATKFLTLGTKIFAVGLRVGLITRGGSYIGLNVVGMFNAPDDSVENVPRQKMER